jgi:hypothetical protein
VLPILETELPQSRQPDRAVEDLSVTEPQCLGDAAAGRSHDLIEAPHAQVSEPLVQQLGRIYGD